MDAIGVIKHLKWAQSTHELLKSIRSISAKFLLIQNCKILGFITFSLRPLPEKSETKEKIGKIGTKNAVLVASHFFSKISPFHLNKPKYWRYLENCLGRETCGWYFPVPVFCYFRSYWATSVSAAYCFLWLVVVVMEERIEPILSDHPDIPGLNPVTEKIILPSRTDLIMTIKNCFFFSQ